LFTKVEKLPAGSTPLALVFVHALYRTLELINDLAARIEKPESGLSTQNPGTIPARVLLGSIRTALYNKPLSNIQGEFMAKLKGLSSIVSELRAERTNLVNELKHVDAALSLLGKVSV